MKIIIRCEDDNLRNMEGRSGDSTEPGSSSPEKEKSDAERRQERTGGTIASPGSAPKIPEPEAEEAKDQRTTEDHSFMNPDPVCLLDEFLQSPAVGDSPCPGAPDPDLLDDPGAETVLNTADLQPPGDPTGRRCGDNIYHSVLHQLLQQQKHKAGRKHKKKTLMKMAKLLVIAKGWDHRENQSLSLEEESDLKEEISSSISRKRAPKAGRIKSKPENLKTDGNLPEPSDLHPSSDPASHEQNECTEKEETSREQEPKRRSRAAKAKKEEELPDEASGQTEVIQENKEEAALMDPTVGEDPELNSKGKLFETKRQPVSSGGKRRRKRNPVIHPQAESDTGWTSSVGEMSALEIQTQEATKQPQEDGNPAAGGRPLQAPIQIDPQEKGSLVDTISKLGRRKPQKLRAKTKPDETEDGLKRGKIRRSCTLVNNTLSGTQEWLIRYLKGSRRKACSKSIKTEGHLEDEPQLMNENERKTKQTKKRGKKTRVISLASAVPGKEKRSRKTKQEPSDAGCPGFLSLQSSALGPSRQEEKTRTREQGEGQKAENVGASGGPTRATPESSEPRSMEPMQAEVTKGASLESNFKTTPTKTRRGPKRRQVSKKQPEILESEGKHVDERETGRTSDFCPRGGREMKDGASTQDGSSWTETGRPTGATPELLETNRINLLPVISEETQDETKRTDLLQIQGMSDLKDEFLGVKTARRKVGRKRRRMLKKVLKTGAKILESDGKHLEEKEIGRTSDFCPGGGREMEDGASIQDGSSWTETGRPTGATLELLETNRINLLPVISEEIQDKFLGVNSMVKTTGRKMGRKRRRMIKKDKKTEPGILESEGKHLNEGEKGRTSDFCPEGGGEMKDGASTQDGSSWTETGCPTGATPELLETNRINLLPVISEETQDETKRTDLLQIQGMSDLKDEFLGVKTARRKVGRKRRRMLKKVLKTGAKILESDKQHLHGGEKETPKDGKTSNIRQNVSMREDGASCLLDAEADKEPKRSSQNESNRTEEQDKTGETRSGLKREGKVDLLQTEGVTNPKVDSVKVSSQVRALKRQRGRKRRRTLKTALAGHENLTSNEDARAMEEIRQTCGFRCGRKTNVSIIKKEDGASFIMENEVDKEPETEKLFQDSVSSAAPRKTRKRRRRSKTHWTGNRKAKRPQAHSFWDVPTSCDETSNVQLGYQKNPTIVASAPEIYPEQKEKKKSLRCSFCLRSFRHISAFTLHKRLHTGRKPFGCSVCGHSFSKLSQLKLHSRLHRQPPAARCPCCEETFKDKKELICHLEVHINEVERLQAKLGGSRRSSVEQVNTFRCDVCSKEFTKKITFEKHQQIHGKKLLSCRKTLRNPTKIGGFLVSRVGDAAVLTPVFFKCPVCQQNHRHWCHYVLHLQFHTSGRSDCCDTCKQEYSQAAGARRHCGVCCRASGQEEACGGSLKNIWKDGGGSERGDQQSTGPDGEYEGVKPELTEQEFDLRSFIPSPSGSGQSEVGDCELDVLSLSSGFSSVSVSESHQVSWVRPEPPRVSRRSWCGSCGRASACWNKPRRRRRLRQHFRCRRCELEFGFLGSFLDHLQEHQPQMQHACPSCSCTFSDAAELKSHMSSRHKQPDSLKCSACGKLFSALSKLRRHKLLHKGAGSHVCLPCSRSFSCYSALKDHLDAHRRRPAAPKPACVEEPFLFPYPCRKCSARFSSTDLLQAHQVCHFMAGRQTENSPENTLSLTPKIQRVTAPSSEPKRRLPVSYRKDLFRYPDPDHLYVVPAVSSETPSVVLDADEQADDSPLGKLTSAELQLQLLIKSLIPEKRLNSSDSSESECEETTRHGCAICTKTFPDIPTLHEHYRSHARGM